MYIITIVAVLVWAGSGFFSAWLAGRKYKLQSIITIGMVILSIGVFLDNVISLLSLATANSGSSVWMRVFGSVSKVLLAVVTGSVITNVLQLAIEQIPEASASQLSSLMSWFVFSCSLGWWLNSSVKGIYVNCMAPLDILQYKPILKLIFSSFLAFCFDFDFSFQAQAP